MMFEIDMSLCQIWRLVMPIPYIDFFIWCWQNIWLELVETQTVLLKKDYRLYFGSVYVIF